MKTTLLLIAIMISVSAQAKELACFDQFKKVFGNLYAQDQIKDLALPLKAFPADVKKYDAFLHENKDLFSQRDQLTKQFKLAEEAAQAAMSLGSAAVGTQLLDKRRDILDQWNEVEIQLVEKRKQHMINSSTAFSFHTVREIKSATGRKYAEGTLYQVNYPTSEKYLKHMIRSMVAYDEQSLMLDYATEISGGLTLSHTIYLPVESKTCRAPIEMAKLCKERRALLSNWTISFADIQNPQIRDEIDQRVSAHSERCKQYGGKASLKVGNNEFEHLSSAIKSQSSKAPMTVSCLCKSTKGEEFAVKNFLQGRCDYPSSNGPIDQILKTYFKAIQATGVKEAQHQDFLNSLSLTKYCDVFAPMANTGGIKNDPSAVAR